MKRLALIALVLTLVCSAAFALTVPTDTDRLTPTGFPISDDAILFTDTSRKAPAPLGTKVAVWSDSYDAERNTLFEVKMVEVIRGDKASELILEKSKYNKVNLEAGTEYVYIKVDVKLLAKNESKQQNLSSYSFSFVRQDGKKYPTTFDMITGFEESFEAYSGAEGYIEIFKAIEIGDEPLIVMDDAWFSLIPAPII